jgi:SAM-dependent methyltransferase
MSPQNQIAEEQAALWNGHSGQAWTEAQELMDGMLQPFKDHLLAAISAAAPRRLLDIGSGTGSTTLAAAWRFGPECECVGLDISEPMLALARKRAAREGSHATFMKGDAQRYAFQPAAFDCLISRFGVMFFDDPVAAFTNLHRAASPGAELRFVAWRSGSENPFMTTAERAAAPLLPDMPARNPELPGQFAFADEQRVRRILRESGWEAIEIQPLDRTCTLPEQSLVPYVTRFGPLGAKLREADDATRIQVVDTVRGAFEPYVHGAEVRFNAACWSIAARAAASDGRRVPI